MTIDEKNAYEITCRLAFPRLVGTEGEKKAIEITDEEFEKAGYKEVIHEEFKTSMYSWIISRWVFILFGLILIMIAVSFYFNHWITLILLGIVLIAGAKSLGMISPPGIKLSRHEKNNYETENIFVKTGNEKAKITVVLMAHYDSKGQGFPKILTIINYIVVVFGIMMIALVYLLLSIIRIFIVFEILILNNILLITSISIAVFASLNYFNKVSNKSPGAADDGAGVGAVIEMARYFKENPLDDIKFIFLATSSEELNLGGAKTFIDNHNKELDVNNTFFINLDSFGGEGPFRLISKYGIPKKSSSDKLNNLFIEVSKDLGIRVRDIYLPTGAWSDYMPAVQAGYEACWIDCMSGGIKYVHTKKDTISLVSKEGLKKGIQLCVEVIKRLDKNSN